MANEAEVNTKIPSCDAYFDAIQARKRLPSSLQESLTSASAQISISSFPDVPRGKEIMTSMVDMRDESRGRPIQKIKILLGKPENFD